MSGYSTMQGSYGPNGSQGSNIPKETKKKIKLVTKFSAMLQAFNSDIEVPENLVVPATDETLSRVGARNVQNHAFALFGVSPDYKKAVHECVALAETNPVFSPIIRKLTRTVAEAETRVVFENMVFDEDDESEYDQEQLRRASEIIDKMLLRTSWNDKKEEFVRAMLNEGGLSLEVVVSDKADRVDRLEYRPHFSIVPLSNTQGVFEDPLTAYAQVNSMGKTIATFALWQLSEVNLEESAFHNRGIPHLQAARQLLQYSGIMTKGLMQKWIRESGSIEHFNLEDARKWEEVDKFRQENEETLNASPDNLVRQFFTKGKVEIERITADSASQDTSSIEFMLDLIFLAAGVAKEILGFKSQVIIKDMIDVAVDNYFQQLEKIQKRLHKSLKKVIDFELLVNGILPENVPYTIVGGRFEITRQVKKIPKEAIEVGAVSINDIRRSINLPSYVHPMWDIPGLYNDSMTARKIARATGVNLPFDTDEMEEIDADAEDAKNEDNNENEKELEAERKEKRDAEEKQKAKDAKEFATDAASVANFTAPRTIAKTAKRKPRPGVIRHNARLLETVPDNHTNSTRLISMMLAKHNSE